MDFVKPCAFDYKHYETFLEFYCTFVLSFPYFDFLNLFYFVRASAKVIMEADPLYINLQCAHSSHGHQTPKKDEVQDDHSYLVK
jgi:hypothetical protein